MPKRHRRILGRFPGLFLALILGLTMGSAGLALAEGDPVRNEPDPVHGEQVFKKCKQCHTVVRGQKKVGPSLAGVVGRRPGSVEGFGYSQDMIDFGAAGNFWNPETLNLFLTKPRDLMRNTKMAFPGLRKPSDRDDLIAYLSQF